MTRSRRQQWSLALIVISGALAISQPRSPACGYHDDVSLARGLLNWVYPDALHVIGAISAAVAERRLPAGIGARDRPGLLVGYHGVVRALDLHARQLSASSGAPAQPAFSLLLIEPMLWTRFVPDGGGVRTLVHVSGPEAEDLVVISGEEVIRAIANNSLTVGEAYHLGLVRFYGAPEQVASFLARYGEVGKPGAAH